jgi:hypothetical protein
MDTRNLKYEITYDLTKYCEQLHHKHKHITYRTHDWKNIDNIITRKNLKPSFYANENKDDNGIERYWQQQN